MKNTKILFGILLLAVLAMPFAFAEEVSDSEQTDYDVLSDTTGIELRLEQLKESLELKIEHANNVIDVLNTKNEDSTSELEIIAELQTLLEEANALSSSDENVVESIIAIKDRSFELANQFRLNVGSKLTGNEKSEIAKANSEDREQIKAKYKENIQNKVQEANSKRLLNFMNNKGINDEALQMRLMSKEITPAQAMKELKENIQSMNAEKRNNLKQKIAEDNAKQKVAAQAMKEKANVRKEAINAKIKERVESKLELLKERKPVNVKMATGGARQ